MAVRGVGYFDGKGQFHKNPEEATISDLSGLLGRVGEGDSLAPGIAKILLDRRREIEHIFADHDAMMEGLTVNEVRARRPVLVADATVTRMLGSKPA
jgi:hypothetical protein